MSKNTPKDKRKAQSNKTSRQSCSTKQEVEKKKKIVLQVWICIKEIYLSSVYSKHKFVPMVSGFQTLIEAKEKSSRKMGTNMYFDML